MDSINIKCVAPVQKSDQLTGKIKYEIKILHEILKISQSPNIDYMRSSYKSTRKSMLERIGVRRWLISEEKKIQKASKNIKISQSHK